MMGAATASSAQVIGGCETPISARTADEGCYLVAAQALGKLPADELFWHIYTYPTLAAANAVRPARGAVVQSQGKVWLYAIAHSAWRPRSGVRLALVGPLPHDSQTAYTARYMEAAIPPGRKTRVHVHSGPEAWYVLEGAQCLETPEGITVVRAGESALVRQGPPMMLSGMGSVTRRTVLLVLHDAAQPWMASDTTWKPKGLCPP
jgi:mannose-6-phosphate isomerase-like protein (cupin superfamily)